MNSQSQKLAKEITSKLRVANLICAEDEEVFTQKLSEGKLKSQDWRLEIEKAIDSTEAK